MLRVEVDFYKLSDLQFLAETAYREDSIIMLRRHIAFSLYGSIFHYEETIGETIICRLR